MGWGVGGCKVAVAEYMSGISALANENCIAPTLRCLSPDHFAAAIGPP